MNSDADHPVGILTTDARLVVRSWDGWLARVTGLPAEQATGRQLGELFPELASRGLLARLKRVVTEGAVEVLAPALHQYLLPCPPIQPSKRFDRMQQRVRMAPLREADRIVGSIITIEDVTARRERELDLAARLASPDEAARVEAARDLAAGDEEDLPQLVRAMGDSSWRVRRAAVDGLARQGGDQTIIQLLRALREQHQDPSVLNSALSVLAMSQLDVITPLGELLQDPDPAVRTYAALALGLQNDSRAVAPLLDALADADANVRYHAIEALGRLRASEAVEVLLGVVETRDFFLAFPALDALVRIGDATIAPRLVPLLEDELLRAPAAEALGRLGDARSVPALAALLNRPGAPVAAIIHALLDIHTHYETAYQEGAHVADLVRNNLTDKGVLQVLEHLETAPTDELPGWVRLLGWVELPAADAAMARLLVQPQARREVVEALVRHGWRVTDLLLQQLQGGTVESRHAAVAALGRIGDPRAVPALLELLAAEDELLVVTAGALARIGDPRALEGLLALLAHPDAAVRQAAVAGLNSLGHPDLPARIEKLLTDPDPFNRESAARIAGYFGYDNCLSALLALCHDPEEAVRRVAVESVACLDDPRVPGLLLEKLNTDTPRVRAAAAQGLAHIAPAQAVPALLQAARDAEPWVRYAATRSLGRLAAPESFDTLAHLALHEPAGHVRAAAIDALGQIKGARAVTILAPLAEAENLDLARPALQALGEIGHPDVLPVLLAALRSRAAERRLEAVRALGRRGGAGVAGALQWAAAVDPDPQVSRAAVDALAQLATPEAIAALIALSADAARRDLVVAGLAQAGARNLDLLAQGLTHPQTGVRLAVVNALSRVRHPEASAQLQTALNDPEAAVRYAAAVVLGRMGNRDADRLLAQLARTDADPAVRRAAEEALKQ